MIPAARGGAAAAAREAFDWGDVDPAGSLLAFRRGRSVAAGAW